MKRIRRVKRPIHTFMLFILLLTLFRFGAFADDIGFTPQINGTLKTGKTFEIILSSTEPVSSFLLRISFDPGSVELKNVTAAKGSAVRTSKKTGEADVIWFGKKALSSRLLTYRFKALGKDSTDIIITPLSAVSTDARLVDFSPSAAITVSVGETSSSVSRSSSASSSSSKSSASKKKGVSSSSASNENTSPNESSPTQLIDLAAPSSRVPGIILTAVIAAVVIALVLMTGILIGRKTRSAIKKPPDTRETLTKDNKE